MLRTLSDMLQCWRRKPNSYWNKGWNVVPRALCRTFGGKKKQKGERLRGKNFLCWENRFWFCQYFIMLDVTRWVLSLYSSLWIFRLCIDFFSLKLGRKVYTIIPVYFNSDPKSLYNYFWLIKITIIKKKILKNRFIIFLRRMF